MSRVPGILAIVLALLYGALPARAAQDTALERGTAITDPATLRELDGGKFRLDRMLLPERSADISRANSAAGENAPPPRLPMTLNLVLKAKAEGSTITCSDIASRWLGGTLPAKDGPLDLIGHENIDRIETNLQIAHAPKSSVRDFRT